LGGSKWNSDTNVGFSFSTFPKRTLLSLDLLKTVQASDGADTRMKTKNSAKDENGKDTIDFGEII
jgi:hypothetical protein